MHLHRLGVCIGQCERCADATRRANGAEEIGVFIALVGGLTRSRSASCPLANQAVLLPDARFVLEPNFDWFALWNMGEMRVQRG
jgi:hypothetical protein